jgi:AhpD family alkylhydroperoxidase
MAYVEMVSEQEATGKVSEVYEEIRSVLETDTVPPLYRAMAPNPAILEANWNRKRTIMDDPGKLDGLTKHMIAVAVSATNGCKHCTETHLDAVRELGLDDEAVVELMAVVDLLSGFNRFVEGLQIEAD